MEETHTGAGECPEEVCEPGGNSCCTRLLAGTYGPLERGSHAGTGFPPKPFLADLKTMPSCTTAGCLGEETNPHPATTSFQVVVESDEVTPEPPLLSSHQFTPDFRPFIPLRSLASVNMAEARQ
ncbi:hypothetical protein BTVI_93925 [Pitangus sulphuratus]|nr:hypothetical protein BTVI_93925 [Pitangus sulphuratus]